MAVRVFGIGLAMGMLGGKQHQKIRGQVGEGMDTIRYQRLGAGRDTDPDFHDTQYQVQHGPHERHLAHFPVARIHCVGYRDLIHTCAPVSIRECLW